MYVHTCVEDQNVFTFVHGGAAWWNHSSRCLTGCNTNWLLWWSHLQAKITDYIAIPLMHIDQVNCVGKQIFSYKSSKSWRTGSPWLLYHCDEEAGREEQSSLTFDLQAHVSSVVNSSVCTSFTFTLMMTGALSQTSPSPFPSSPRGLEKRLCSDLHVLGLLFDTDLEGMQ